MASATKSDDDEISLIIARAAISVPLPSLSTNKEAPRTKGEQMKLILENMRFQHDQIRKQIFAQCPPSIPRSTLAELRTQAFDKQQSPGGRNDVGKAIVDLLRASYSIPEKRAPSTRFALPPVVEPNQPYGKPLPQTQSLQMQPFLHELAPILQALDTFNLHAFNELHNAEKEKEKMESNGTARTLLANVTARKRSAHDADLDRSNSRPPINRSATSSTKGIERPFVKKNPSLAQTEEEIMSERRRNEKIRLKHSSPVDQVSKSPTKLSDPPRSPVPSSIRGPGTSNTGHKPSPYSSKFTSSYSPKMDDRSDVRGRNGTNATNGAYDVDQALSSSPNGNVHPSRVEQVQSFPLLSSPAMARQKIPRSSSRDPRLIHRNAVLEDKC